MNKTELIDQIAKDAEISKVAAGKALDSFTTAVQRTLKRGEKLQLVGFGTFSITKRAARKGRNPRTGETIKIKAARIPKFTAGKALKSKV